MTINSKKTTKIVTNWKPKPLKLGLLSRRGLPPIKKLELIQKPSNKRLRCIGSKSCNGEEYMIWEIYEEEKEK